MWVMRHILHDWSDGDAARILAALRGAIGTTPVTLCICEARLPSSRTSVSKLCRWGLGHPQLLFLCWVCPPSSTEAGWHGMAVWMLAAVCVALASSATPVSFSHLCLLNRASSLPQTPWP